MRANPPTGELRSSRSDLHGGGQSGCILLLHGLWLLGLLLCCLPQSVNAAIYACATPEGTTIFQDRPCPRVKPLAKAAKPVAQLPFGIHKSWFDIPSQAEGRAFCDRRGCECGPVERRHEGSLEQAVADALFMDTGWHHYQVSHAAWLNTPTSSSRIHDVRDTMIEASCTVMMSQQLLRDYADDIARVLRNRVRKAEERGYDIPEPCDAGNKDACDYYNSVLLYQQMMSDANALKVPRDVLESSAGSTKSDAYESDEFATTE